jgi:hypothetical protein
MWPLLSAINCQPTAEVSPCLLSERIASRHRVRILGRHDVVERRCAGPCQTPVLGHGIASESTIPASPCDIHVAPRRRRPCPGPLVMAARNSTPPRSAACRGPLVRVATAEEGQQCQCDVAPQRSSISRPFSAAVGTLSPLQLGHCFEIEDSSPRRAFDAGLRTTSARLDGSLALLAAATGLDELRPQLGIYPSAEPACLPLRRLRYLRAGRCDGAVSVLKSLNSTAIAAALRSVSIETICTFSDGPCRPSPRSSVLGRLGVSGDCCGRSASNSAKSSCRSCGERMRRSSAASPPGAAPGRSAPSREARRHAPAC